MSRVWLVVLVGLVLPLACVARYQPTWESLDARPLPSWYRFPTHLREESFSPLGAPALSRLYS
jgi:hypothetical protein